jgi:hypothetical protein
MFRALELKKDARSYLEAAVLAYCAAHVIEPVCS